MRVFILTISLLTACTASVQPITTGNAYSVRLPCGFTKVEQALEHFSRLRSNFLNHFWRVNAVRTSDAGVEFIKEKEGFRSEAYKDSVGVWTIGYGHTMGVGPGDYITEEDADMLMRAELLHYENAVERFVFSTLTQNEFDALVSLCYNIGPGNFAKSSVVRFINDGYKRRAADCFGLWNKGRVNGRLVVLAGLTNRRRAERELFLTA